MFNEEAFINKMVTSYLSSNKNKRVSNVQKASFGEIMKYIVTSMNLHITPDEAKNALKTGTLKNKNSGNMVALKTVFEKDEYDGQSKPVLIITINNGKGDEHKIKLYDNGRLKLFSKVKGVGLFSGDNLKGRMDSFKLNFYNPESIEYMNKVGSDVVDSDDSWDLNCPYDAFTSQSGLIILKEYMQTKKKKKMSIMRQTENVDDFNATYRRKR